VATRETEQKQTETRPPISVKGVKSGLLFVVDEQCSHPDLIAHLSNLLHGELASLFDGPETSISVDYGTRDFTRDESNELLEMFLSKENFVLREYGTNTVARKSLFHNNRANTKLTSLHRGTVRAGQQLMFEGDVVIIGDVNPGGQVAATGDIYVLGRLRGIAHAGSEGNERAIIAAAEFAPMQLRIADWISRAPETSLQPLQTFMEFAYLREDGMAVDKLMYVQSIRGE